MQVATDWILTPHRAAIHVPTATAVVADLHLGYGAVRQASGEAIPSRGIEDTIADLEKLFTESGVSRLVIAGDLLEKSRVSTQATDLLRWLQTRGIELVGVIPGNHDLNALQPLLGERLVPDGLRLGEWHVVHGHERLPMGKVIYGHHHPSLAFGRQVKAPCYVVGGRSIILPAHSRNASGANILARQTWHRWCCYVIAGDKVLDFGVIGVLGRRLSGIATKDGHTQPPPSRRPMPRR
ncbi:metallophosphoesterase family protein [soil metagenome]